jgi:uncharacterized protein (DUF58 family)
MERAGRWWRTALRPALAGLTTRGRSFISAGVAAALCAVLLGQQDLLRVAVLLTAVPLGCALMLTRAHYRVALERSLAPHRVPAGSTVRVRLELENLARAGTRVLLAEDQVPYPLGAAPRFVVDRLPGGRRAAVTYSLRPEIRGHYAVGPLHLRVGDPFGMCELDRSFTGADPVTVVPRVWPLGQQSSGGTWGGAGESLARAAAVSGEDDIAIREYREGDDLRRVHWRSTARRGQLMVRREERPRQYRATVLLDTRRHGHEGEGLASSFEWAVSAAASAAVHFTDRGHGVRLLLDGRPTGWTGPHTSDPGGELLDRLAVARFGPDDALHGALRTLRRGQAESGVIAVLGDITPEQAAELAALPITRSGRLAFLLRTEDWDGAAGGREISDGRRERVLRILRDARWQVAEVGPQDTPTQAWARATGTAAERDIGTTAARDAGRPVGVS